MRADSENRSLRFKVKGGQGKRMTLRVGFGAGATAKARGRKTVADSKSTIDNAIGADLTFGGTCAKEEALVTVW